MTNWAYGITVALTLASGIAMLMASSADNAERRAVEQRQVFDQLSEEVESGAWELSDLARLYIIKKNQDVLQEYRQQTQAITAIERRLVKLKDNGATAEELALLREGLQMADELQDEQRTALAQVARGEKKRRSTCFTAPPMSRSSSGSRRSLTTFA